MRKVIKYAGTMMVCLLAVFLLRMPVMADDQTSEVISLDVSMENTENENYKVMDDAINIRKDGVVYELTGTTDRKLQIWGSNNPDPVKTFYLRLNNVTVNGGITITNSYGAKLVIEVVDGTNNTIKNVYAVDLSITGSGTLNASDLGVTQQGSDNRLASALYIKDTTINVTRMSNNPSQWNGGCVLDGNADITYITDTEYAPLALGQTNKFKHSLVMKENAKLRCLHSNADVPSAFSVSGMEAYNVEKITLQDSAYLEVQGRDGTEYAGYGLILYGDIEVKDNARVKATGYDVAICVEGNVNVFGGKIVAESKYSNAMYAAGTISIGNAEAELTGYYPALFGNGDVSVENSLLTAASMGDCAIFSRSGITLTNSSVDANGADGYYGIYSNNGINASGCWIETTGPETLDDAPNSITNSVLFNGNEGKVIGNASLPKDVTVAENMTLEIPEGTALNVPDGKTLINNGKILVKGEMNPQATGSVICNSHNGGTATCASKAVCDICKAEYGDIAPNNHVNLKQVTANAATAATEGNIEYWYCDGCGRYFRDSAATTEISQADTVIAKLTPDGGTNAGNNTTNNTASNNNTTITGNNTTQTTTAPTEDAGSNNQTDTSVMSPKTGELSNGTVYIVLFASLCGMAVLLRKRNY